MKEIFLSFLIAGCFLNCDFELTASDLEPYNSINILPFDSHGWFGNAEQLKTCFNEKPVATVIEVGSWLGCSTRFLGSSIKKGGKVYAVDTWLGSSEAEHEKNPRLSYLYQQFLSNVKHAGLTDIIVPVRMTSLEAAKALNVKADLIYIDAAHDTKSVLEDILAWYPHLNENGIMCGDDWTWQSVQAAVIQAADQLDKSIYSSGNFWRFY